MCDPKEMAQHEDEPCAGECVSSKKLIKINKDQSKEDYVHTFFHECFHALFDRISISQTLSSDLNEIISDSAATWITENFEAKLKK